MHARDRSKSWFTISNAMLNILCMMASRVSCTLSLDLTLWWVWIVLYFFNESVHVVQSIPERMGLNLVYKNNNCWPSSINSKCDYMEKAKKQLLILVDHSYIIQHCMCCVWCYCSVQYCFCQGSLYHNNNHLYKPRWQALLIVSFWLLKYFWAYW